jgi:hypothetical protein
MIYFATAIAGKATACAASGVACLLATTTGCSFMQCDLCMCLNGAKVLPPCKRHGQKPSDSLNNRHFLND